MIGAMRVSHAAFLGLALAAALPACSSNEQAAADVPDEGEPVTPPFEVAGDAEGLLLVWFDEEGLHTAQRREEIPETRRGAVRVDDLSLPPDERLDPELVYVADLSAPGTDGQYPVRRMPRATFDARVEEVSGAVVEAEPVEGGEATADADADVVIYGASWCHACRSAAAFLRERNVPFVERDIEREPGAREAMMQAAREAGVSPRGIPVIDFRGEIIRGFDRGALERAIARSSSAI